MAKKLYDSFKQCVVSTHDDSYSQIFDNSWKYADMESWMLDTFSIDVDSVTQIVISTVKYYKYGKS